MGKKKYLEDYSKWLENNRSPFLCVYYMGDDLFHLFKPTSKELVEHGKDGYNTNGDEEGGIPWGCKLHGEAMEFTDIRQKYSAVHGRNE